MMLGFFIAGGAADFGWVAYAPLSNAVELAGGRRRPVDRGPRPHRVLGHLHRRQPRHHDLLSARPGHDDVPDADLHLEHARHRHPDPHRLPGAHRGADHAVLRPALRDAHLSSRSHGGTASAACLWQNLFWFFGHPEVYILALPYFGIVTEVIPVFSRKPLFGYKGMVFATMSIAALSTGGLGAPHVHDRRRAAAVLLACSAYLIAVPTGIKFFNWIGTMWRGQLQFKTPMLFCDRLPARLPDRRRDRHHARLATDRLRHPRHLLRRRPLPPGAVRDGGLRRVRRLLLLVPEDVRPDAQRAPRQVALLAACSSASGSRSCRSTSSA